MVELVMLDNTSDASKIANYATTAGSATSAAVH
jgi:hypothetical protein